MKIRVEVNGETQEADVAPRTLLVHWLREDPALTGTHRALCAPIEEADPTGDPHASADYRLHLAGVFIARAVATAIERAKD